MEAILKVGANCMKNFFSWRGFEEIVCAEKKVGIKKRKKYGNQMVFGIFKYKMIFYSTKDSLFKPIYVTIFSEINFTFTL